MSGTPHCHSYLTRRGLGGSWLPTEAPACLPPAAVCLPTLSLCCLLCCGGAQAGGEGGAACACTAHRCPPLFCPSPSVSARCARAGLERFGLVHEHKIT